MNGSTVHRILYIMPSNLCKTYSCKKAVGWSEAHLRPAVLNVDVLKRLPMCASIWRSECFGKASRRMSLSACKASTTLMLLQSAAEESTMSAHYWKISEFSGKSHVHTLYRPSKKRAS